MSADHTRSVLDPEPLGEGESWSPPAGLEALPDVLARVERALREMPSPEEATARVAQLMLANVRDLRSESGRLNAAAIADALHISISALARAMHISAELLEEEADAQRWQNALAGFARVVSALRDLVREREDRIEWLGRSQPRWSERSALDLMLAGEAETVARLLERIRDGGGGE